MQLTLDSDSVSGRPSGHGSTESSEVNSESSDVTDVTPVAKRKKQSKFMELLSDVMSSAATLSADKTCEENAKIETLRLNCNGMWMMLCMTGLIALSIH